MGKVSEKTVTFLYRVFMAVLSIGAFLLCLPDYIGIKKATIVKVAGFLVVILVMALMQSFRGKLRLYGAGLLLAFGMLVVGITGVSESVELVEGFFSWLFAQEGWQVGRSNSLLSVYSGCGNHCGRLFSAVFDGEVPASEGSCRFFVGRLLLFLLV